MKLVKEIASIVAEYSPEKPEIFLKSKSKVFETKGGNHFEGKDVAYYRAFHALNNGEVQTEEELRALIFPNGTSDANYRSFKSRLKKRLVNSLMLISIDADDISNTDAAEGEALYYFYTAYVASVLGHSFLASELQDEAILIARKYDIFYVELQLLEERLRYFSSLGSKRKYEQYYQLWLKARDNYLLHVEAVQIGYRFQKAIRGKYGRTEDLLKAMEHSINEYQQLLEKLEFDSAFVVYFRLCSGLSLAKNKFDEILTHCDSYQEYLERKPHFNSPSRQLNIAELRRKAYFFLGDYARSKQIIEDALNRLPDSRIRMSINKRIYCLQYGIYSLDLEYAFNQFCILSNKSTANLIDEPIRSHFVFLKAYLWLSYFLGIAQDSQYPSGIERKDVQIFISKRPNILSLRNDIPEYEHDQSGGLSVLRMFESIMIIITAREDIVSRQRSLDFPLSNDKDIQLAIENAIIYFKKHVPKDQKRVFAFAEIIRIISQNLYETGKQLSKRVEGQRKKLPSTFICDDIELLPFDKLADHLLIWWEKIAEEKVTIVTKK
jgi:hypothetical protein